MKKKNLIMLIALMMFTTSCSDDKKGDEPPIIKTPEEMTNIEALNKITEKFESKNEFACYATGEITTNVLFINYTQKLSSVRIKTSEGVFNEVITTSTFVKNADRFFFKDDNIYHIEADKITSTSCEWSEEISNMTQDEYKEAYGFLPTDLTHFILNENTIISNTLKEENGKYIYSFILDLVNAPKPEIINMEHTLGKDADIEFVSIEMIITVNKDLDVLSIQTIEEYYAKVPVIGKALCKSIITETFEYENINNSGYELFVNVLK